METIRHMISEDWFRLMVLGVAWLLNTGIRTNWLRKFGYLEITICVAFVFLHMGGAFAAEVIYPTKTDTQTTGGVVNATGIPSSSQPVIIPNGVTIKTGDHDFAPNCCTVPIIIDPSEHSGTGTLNPTVIPLNDDGPGSHRLRIPLQGTLTQIPSRNDCKPTDTGGMVCPIRSWALLVRAYSGAVSVAPALSFQECTGIRDKLLADEAQRCPGGRVCYQSGTEIYSAECMNYE